VNVATLPCWLMKGKTNISLPQERKIPHYFGFV
jgi:hypothetical protein